MSAISRDAFVSIAGVGAAAFPTTVCGISSIHSTWPKTINSASAAGVYSVNSADAPAPDKPGINEVSVVPIVQINTGSITSAKYSINSVDP